MNNTKIHILLLTLAVAILPMACSELTVHETACALPEQNAPTNIPPDFIPDAEQEQACIAVYNQSDTDVTITLTHEDHTVFDMRNIIAPHQPVIFVVPAGEYYGTESYPILVEHHGDMNLKKGRCYEWLVGEEPEQDNDNEDDDNENQL